MRAIILRGREVVVKLYFLDGGVLEKEKEVEVIEL